MNFQPTSFNGALQAGAVLRGRALVAEWSSASGQTTTRRNFRPRETRIEQ
jgi:hypothetical protein